MQTLIFVILILVPHKNVLSKQNFLSCKNADQVNKKFNYLGGGGWVSTLQGHNF